MSIHPIGSHVRGLHPRCVWPKQIVVPCSRGRSSRPRLCPASSCTTPADAWAWGSSGPWGGSGRCSRPPRWADRPRCGPWCSWKQDSRLESVWWGENGSNSRVRRRASGGKRDGHLMPMLVSDLITAFVQRSVVNLVNERHVLTLPIEYDA